VNRGSESFKVRVQAAEEGPGALKHEKTAAVQDASRTAGPESRFSIHGSPYSMLPAPRLTLFDYEHEHEQEQEGE
jgi:hypothetical protein